MLDFIREIIEWVTRFFNPSKGSGSTTHSTSITVNNDSKRRPEPTATQVRKIKEPQAAQPVTESPVAEEKKKLVNYKTMTKKELLALAKRDGVKANASMNKQAIAKAINDAR